MADKSHRFKQSQSACARVLTSLQQVPITPLSYRHYIIFSGECQEFYKKSYCALMYRRRKMGKRISANSAKRHARL